MKNYLAVLVVALALCAGCVDRQAQKQAIDTEKLIKDKAVAVQVQAATESTVEDTIEVTGSIQTTDDVNVTAIVGGPLVSVLMEDGDQVSAGQVIARQDDSDYRARVTQARALAQAAKAVLDQAKADAEIGPSKSEAQVKASDARLEQSKARLLKLINGSRPEERKRAEAQVQRAQSDMDTAKSALDRAKRLYKEGAISEAEMEQAQNAYSAALSGYEAALQDQRLVQQSSRAEDVTAAEQEVRAAEQQLAIDKADQRLDVLYGQRVDSAQANWESAKQNLELAQLAMDNTVLRAPFSGRISGRPMQAGTYVGPGTAVARVVGVGGAYFEAQVPESQIARIRSGMSVDVEVDALPGKVAAGTVVAANPQATSAGRLFFVRIRLDDPPEGLKAGMFARGTGKIGERSGVVLVPSSAVLKDGDKATVYVVQGDKAKRVGVTVGATRNGQTEVVGVTVGDKVVVRGQEGLSNGTTIKIEGAKVAGGT